jgi:AcrR family transcriptional regulator
MATAKAKKRTRKAPVSKAARRQEILGAARDVFSKRGYHQATIDDVVAAAGVARGTFYLYFDDKRAVFSELIDRFAARISMAIKSIVVDDPSHSIDEQIQANVRAVLTVALNERAMTKILFSDAHGIDPAFDRKLLAFYDEVVQLLAESLQEGQALGIVADGEPRVMAYLSIGAVKELLYQVVTLGLTEESAEVLAQQVFAYVSSGFLRTEQVTKAAKASKSAKSRKRS